MVRSSFKSRSQSTRKHDRKRRLKFESLEQRQVLATILGTGTGALLDGDLTDPDNNGDPDADVNYNAVFRASHKAFFGAPEGAFNVWDNQVGGGNAKWCCDGPGAADRGSLDNQTGTVWVDAQFTEGVVLQRFTITSGNDSPGRDSDQWRILGSNDGANFTPIFTFNHPGTSPFTARNQVVRYDVGTDFNKPAAYTYLRYESYSTVSDATHQLNELEFFGSTFSLTGAGTAMGSGTNALLGYDLTDPENDGAPDANINYNAIFRSNNEPGFGGGEFAFNVFDNNLGGGNNKWCCNFVGTADRPSLDNQVGTLWVEAELPAPVILSRFTASSSNDSPGRDPDQWRILGSNDGVNYAPIFTYNRPGVTPWIARDQVRLFQAGVDYALPATAYSIFRFEAYSTTSDNNLALGELEFFSNLVANDDVYNATEDVVLTVPAPGVLGNDTSISQPFTIVSNTQPGVGAVTVNPDGSFVYNQNGGFDSLPEGQLGSTTFDYSIVNFEMEGRSYVIAPMGPNGELRAYYINPQNLTWDQARAVATSMSLGGKPGHLVTIGSTAENDLVRHIVNRNTVWIGLTDSTLTSTLDNVNLASLGTSESGNTSGQPLPNAGQAPVIGQRGSGWRWVTGEPFIFNNWGDGEPNDAGGEDAAQLRGDGQWNDNQAGDTLGGANTTGQSVVEFDIDTLEGLPGFSLNIVRALNGGSQGLGTADDVMARNLPADKVATAIVTHTDWSDDVGGGNGEFGFNFVPPGMANGLDDNDFFVQTTGTFTTAATASYRFYVRGDDGARLRIDGKDVIIDNTFHGDEIVSSGVVEVAAGAHTFEWLWFEGGGGAFGEASYDNISQPGGRVPFGDNGQGLTVGTMTATTWRANGTNVDINNLTDAQAVLDGARPLHGYPAPIQGLTSVINFDNDGNSTQKFPGDFRIPGLPNGVDDAVVEITAWIYIDTPNSVHTFGFNSDDGFGMTIGGGAVLGSTFNTNNPPVGTLAFNANRGAGTPTLGTYTFPTAGFYPLRVVMYERGGGFNLELFSKPGLVSTWVDDATSLPGFRLVGDVASGGLPVLAKAPNVGQATATVTINVTGVNDAPTVAIVGGPYAIDEGDDLQLGSTASDPDAGETATLTYEWDLDDDGDFSDATGASPNVPWSTLRALEYDGGIMPTSIPIAVRVTDAQGASSIASTTVTVTNTAPVLDFVAPDSAGTNLVTSFDFSATDFSLVDENAGFTFVIDWGDGNSDTITNSLGGTIDHAYSADGDYEIFVTVTDKDGGQDQLTHDITVSSVFIDIDGNLVVVGSNRSDRIILTEKAGGVEVRLNNVRYTMAPLSNTVVVFAGAGSDSVSVYGRSTLNYILHGEGGNDYLAGGNEDDILDGGDGDDRLLGGFGNDILLGGNGNDRASGSSGNDIIYGDGYLDEAGDIDVVNDVQALYFPDNFAAFTEVRISNDGYGRDTLAGDNDDDLIFGGAGNDRINGGNGNDRLWGEDGNDNLSGDNGDDLLVGGDGGDVLYGRAGNDVLIGGNAADRLYGYNGDDLLLGDGLDEMDLEEIYMLWLQYGVYGTQDILDSGSFTVVEDNAIDTLYGQSGADWFVLFNRDVARDPRSDDVVDLDPMP
jgi:hypothetical protein